MQSGGRSFTSGTKGCPDGTRSIRCLSKPLGQAADILHSLCRGVRRRPRCPYRASLCHRPARGVRRACAVVHSHCRPWSPGAPGPSYIPTPDDDPAFLYQDSLIALDPIRGINIGQPSLHAHCLDALALQPEEIAVHVGAASGYSTVILAHPAGPSGRVHAFEIDTDLAMRAGRTHRMAPGSGA
jgi:hypothetical protein